MIGIIGAMQVEVDTLMSAMQDVAIETIASTKFFSGKLGNKQVVVVCCGIGKVNAAMTASFLISKYAVEMIVNIGVAGGLLSSLGVGDIVVSSHCVQYDYQADLVNSPTQHNLDRLYLTYLPCDQVLVQQLHAAVTATNSRCTVGTVATGDKFVADKTEADEIHRKFGAIAIEMESGAIAQVCTLSKVRFATLRTISDSANDEAQFDFAQNMKVTAQKSCNVLLKWLEML